MVSNSCRSLQSLPARILIGARYYTRLVCHCDCACTQCVIVSVTLRLLHNLLTQCYMILTRFTSRPCLCLRIGLAWPSEGCDLHHPGTWHRLAMAFWRVWPFPHREAECIDSWTSWVTCVCDDTGIIVIAGFSSWLIRLRYLCLYLHTLSQGLPLQFSMVIGISEESRIRRVYGSKVNFREGDLMITTVYSGQIKPIPRHWSYMDVWTSWSLRKLHSKLNLSFIQSCRRGNSSICS